MHTKIDDVLNLICKFKMHVQDNLAAYEAMVEDECVEHERQMAAMAAPEPETHESKLDKDETDVDREQ